MAFTNKSMFFEQLCSPPPYPIIGGSAGGTVFSIKNNFVEALRHWSVKG